MTNQTATQSSTVELYVPGQEVLYQYCDGSLNTRVAHGWIRCEVDPWWTGERIWKVEDYDQTTFFLVGETHLRPLDKHLDLPEYQGRVFFEVA